FILAMDLLDGCRGCPGSDNRVPVLRRVEAVGYPEWWPGTGGLGALRPGRRRCHLFPGDRSICGLSLSFAVRGGGNSRGVSMAFQPFETSKVWVQLMKTFARTCAWLVFAAMVARPLFCPRQAWLDGRNAQLLLQSEANGASDALMREFGLERTYGMQHRDD